MPIVYIGLLGEDNAQQLQVIQHQLPRLENIQILDGLLNTREITHKC